MHHYAYAAPPNAALLSPRGHALIGQRPASTNSLSPVTYAAAPRSFGTPSPVSSVQHAPGLLSPRYTPTASPTAQVNPLVSPRGYVQAQPAPVPVYASPQPFQTIQTRPRVASNPSLNSQQNPYFTRQPHLYAPAGPNMYPSSPRASTIGVPYPHQSPNMSPSNTPTQERTMVKKLGVIFPGKTPESPSHEDVYVGKYRLGRTLGEGAYGKVKIATHVDTGMDFAVKSYDKNKIQHDDLKRVRGEIYVMKMLNNQNIIKLVDHIEVSNMIYLVMDLAQDGDLLDFTDERGFLDDDTARPIFRQVVEGVQHFHKLGVIHRDLKLENILLTDGEQTAKISDFGLSYYGNIEDSRTVCGTPVYRAPEMINMKPYTAAVDVWSLGVILYAMLHGAFPFYDDNLQILFSRIRSATYPRPTKGSASAHDLIQKMLNVDERRRITISGILQHPWLNEPVPQPIPQPVPQPVSEPDPVTPPKEPQNRQRRASSLFRMDNRGKKQDSSRFRRASVLLKEGLLPGLGEESGN